MDFGRTPEGGNPAGVVLDASELDTAAMLAVAAEVGYSETPFVTAADPEAQRFTVRYFARWRRWPSAGTRRWPWPSPSPIG